MASLSELWIFFSELRDLWKKWKKKKNDFEPKMKIVRSFVVCVRNMCPKNDLIFAV